MYSEKIKQQIQNYLEKNDWKYIFIPNREYFIFKAKTNCLLKGIDVYIFVFENHCTIVGEIPISVPTQSADAVSEYLELANRNIGEENFELDTETGEIYHIGSIECEESFGIEEDAIRGSISETILNVEKYANGLLNVMFEKMSPKDAIEACEKHSLDKQ